MQNKWRKIGNKFGGGGSQGNPLIFTLGQQYKERKILTPSQFVMVLLKLVLKDEFKFEI